MSSKLMPSADNLVGVGGGQFDIEDIDIGKAFEQDGLALHNGLPGGGADVAESEDGGAVGDHGDQVAFGGVLINEAWVARDFEAGHGDTGSVSQAQVALRLARFGGDDSHFAGGGRGMVLERFFRIDLHSDP
jgi:hypothetical protein